MIFLFCLALQDAGRIPLPDAVRFQPELSADGKWVYYFEEIARADKFPKHARNAALFRATPDGKTVEKVVEVGNSAGGVYWHPDGTHLLVLRRVDDDGADGKIDFRDGESLWMGELDGKNGQILVPASSKRLSLYAPLSDGKLILGLRDAADRPAKVVVRDAQGKDEELVECWSYLAGAQGEDWIAVRDGAETKWHRFSRAQKTRHDPLDARIVGTPLQAGDRLWYVCKKESKSVLVVCDKEGKDPKELTQGDEVFTLVGAWNGGVLCQISRENETEFVQVSVDGKRDSVRTVQGSCLDARTSQDGKRFVFLRVRETTGDNHPTPWEDAGDLYVLP